MHQSHAGGGHQRADHRGQEAGARRISGRVRSPGQARRRVARLHVAKPELLRTVRGGGGAAAILFRFHRRHGNHSQQRLLEQVNSSGLNAADRQLAELIIGNVDDTGFLQTGPEEIANNTGMELADLQRVLEFVQTFHPIGVGARDLRSVCSSNSKRLSKEQSLEYRIVDRHLEDLGKRRFPEIARRLGTAPEQVTCSAPPISSPLSTRKMPGQIFTPDPNNYVLPDVTVEKIGGEWAISLNGEQIPHLRISNTYKDLMSQDKGGTGDKDYTMTKIRNWKKFSSSLPSTSGNRRSQYTHGNYDPAKGFPRVRAPRAEADDYEFPNRGAIADARDHREPRHFRQSTCPPAGRVRQRKYLFLPATRPLEAVNR